MQAPKERIIHNLAIETVKNIKSALPYKIMGYSLSRREVSEKCMMALNQLEKSLSHHDGIALFLDFYDLLVDLQDMDPKSFSKLHTCREVALFLCRAMYKVIEEYRYMANKLSGTQNIYKDSASEQYYETMNTKQLVHQIARLNHVCLDWDFRLEEFKKYKEITQKYQSFTSKMTQQSAPTLEMIFREKLYDEYAPGFKEMLESPEAIEVLQNLVKHFGSTFGAYLVQRSTPYLHGITESEQFDATTSEPIGHEKSKEVKSWECSKLLLTSKVFAEHVSTRQVRDILNASEIKTFPQEFLCAFVRPLLKKVDSAYIYQQIKKYNPESEEHAYWKKILVQKGMRYFAQYSLFYNGVDMNQDVKKLSGAILIEDALQEVPEAMRMF